MRDPARIARICALLQQVWSESPDQRLGQLIINLTPDRFMTGGPLKILDPFHVEDTEWEQILQDAIGHEEEE